MRVFNADKTQELADYDLELGRLVADTLTIHIQAVEGVQEQGHYETIAEYDNGGKDVKWIVDVPAVEAVQEHDETEDILVYIPYTPAELAEVKAGKRRESLLYYLSDTDKYSTKCSELGLSLADAYPDIYANRVSARAEINGIEEAYPHLKSERPSYPL